MIDILRAALFTNTPVSIPDWEPVFEEMKLQTVAALPYHVLPADAVQWRSYCLKKQGQFVRVMYAQDQLIGLLEGSHIPCVILKGAAAAMYYPYPNLRTMGDMDFLVKRGDLKKASALLEKNGYALVNSNEGEYHHHFIYTKDQISFELHWRLGVVSEHDEKRLVFFEEGIDNRQWHEIDGYRFPVLPSRLNGLVLIFHIYQHLRNGLGFRQVIDWMMYVHQLPPEEWEELQPLLKESGMMKLALTVTALCQRYFGLRRIVEDDADLPIDELFAYIHEKGNFGYKAGVDGEIARFGMGASGIKSVFKHLQYGGVYRWDAVRKYKILRPFAWLYQSFRLAGILVKNRKRPGEILKEARYGASQRSLIESLEFQEGRTIPFDH